MNGILSRRDLYQPRLWPSLDQEALILVEKGIADLTEDECLRLNRLFIQAAFGNSNLIPGCYYVVQTFVEYWAQRLFRTRLLVPEEKRVDELSLGDVWLDGDDRRWPPTGVLVNAIPDPAFGHPESRDDMTIFSHRCIGTESNNRHTARALSAGFHQVIPMVVQTALMQRGELLTVENPEVHLHPSLQLDVTELLMRQAKAGKYIVIETHSDLVIRRIIRAFLEEEVSQEAVRLYLADISKSRCGYHFSTLTRLETNDQGQISI